MRTGESPSHVRGSWKRRWPILTRPLLSLPTIQSNTRTAPISTGKWAAKPTLPTMKPRPSLYPGSARTMAEDEFDTRPIRQSDELTLALDGWEGPLDLLLNLARAQRVDLAQISILQLVEQYLTYLAEARALKLEIAADYLVMAAWLAYLKSCLLLPKDPEQDPSPEEIALRLQQRLLRLDAMREAGARLLGCDRVGRDVFLRGAPEGLRLIRKAAWQVRDFDLFAAYGVVRARTQPAMHVVHARAVMTLDEAIERVGKMIGMALDWTFLESFLPQSQDPQFRRSALASSFLAMLELARRGRLEFVQEEAFAPIRLRAAA